MSLTTAHIAYTYLYNALCNFAADDPPFAGTTAGTLPKCGNGGVSDAVTSELGDRQSSHPVKTLLQYYGKSLEMLPGVAYPGFRDNRSTLNTKTEF